jgi:uncharacterized protein with ParB-like and HNH nuclease domain
MADADTFRRIITPSVKFDIPEYQRNYSWTEEELDDLWRDLNNVMSESDGSLENKNHFYGMFLFDVDDEENIYNIIDGQQRITTAIILLNEIKNRMLELGMDDEAAKTRYDYIKDSHGYKLALGPDDDDRVFKDEILVDDRIGQEIESLSDTPSQTRLLHAKQFYARKLESKDRNYLLSLKNEIENLEVMSYEVNSITRAVKIFETANDRGRNLTNLDKTKSFLMLQIYLNKSDDEQESIEDEISLLQTRFGKMYEKIDEINNTDHWGDFSEDNIQRFHYILWDQDWTSSRGERYYQNLLSHLKEKIRSSPQPLEQIEDYSKELQDAFRAHEQITRISDTDDAERRLIKRMELAGSMGNVRPLLLALRMKKESFVGEDEYLDILSRIETLVVRVYVIAQKRAYTGRYKIYRLARDIYQENISIDGIKSRIADITRDYADDEKVKESLSQDDFYGDYDKSEQRYLLYFYEASLQKDSDREKMPFSLRDWVSGQLVGGEEEANIEVDHIHPQTPKEDLGVDDYEHKLGNLSILPEGENSSLQNAARADKKDAYREINLEMNKDVVPELANWDEESILDREEKIKNRILRRWPADRVISLSKQHLYSAGTRVSISII